MPKMTLEIPMTITDTLSWMTASMPMAKSQPQPMLSTMSTRGHRRRKTAKSNETMSTTAKPTDSKLSDLICRALPTATTGPPIKRMSTAGDCRRTLSAHWFSMSTN